MREIREVKNSGAYTALKNVMIQWGFTDTESSIYALLALSPRALTAKEIASIIGRAYSSVMNEINKLIRFGLLERKKGEKCYHYSAVIDIIKIIRNERRKVLGLLMNLKESLDDMGSEYDLLKDHIEEAIEYLGKIEMEEW